MWKFSNIKKIKLLISKIKFKSIQISFNTLAIFYDFFSTVQCKKAKSTHSCQKNSILFLSIFLIRNQFRVYGEKVLIQFMLLLYFPLFLRYSRCLQLKRGSLFFRKYTKTNFLKSSPSFTLRCLILSHIHFSISLLFMQRNLLMMMRK